MKLKSIQLKILAGAGVCLLITAMIIVGYAVLIMRSNAKNVRKLAIDDAERYAVAKAKQYANQIQTLLEAPLDSARTVAQTLSGLKSEDAWLELGRDEVNGILRTLLEKHPEFVATYTCWEPDAFDEMDNGYRDFEGHDGTGRFIPSWTRDTQGNAVLGPLRNYDQEGAGDYYLLPKKTKLETLLEPSMASVQGKEMLITSLIVPIIVADQFYGIIGIDFRLDELQMLVDDVQDMYDGTAQISVISYQGTLVAVTGQPKLTGMFIKELDEDDAEDDLRHIQSGEENIEVQDDEFEVSTPIKIGSTVTPWAVKILIPMEQITAAADNQMQRALGNTGGMVGLSGLCAIVACVILGVLARSITRPLNRAVTISNQIAEGALPEHIEVIGEDETGQLLAAMQKMTETLRQVLKETDRLSQAVQEGMLDVRGHAGMFAGSWGELVVGINKVIDAFMAPFNVTAEYLDRIAKGDIPAAITEAYQGDFNEIKNNLNLLIDSTNEVTHLAQELANGNLQVNVALRSKQDELMQTLEQMIAYIQAVANVAQTISSGDLRVEIILKSEQDILNQALQKMVMYLQEVAAFAESISDGNFQVEVRPKSDQDILNYALKQMILYLQDVAMIADRISNKDLHVDVTPISEHDILHVALQRMVTTLQAMMTDISHSLDEVEQQNWLKTGQTELNNVMRGEQNLATLSKNIITYLARYIEAQVGAMYLLSEESVLKLVSSYAYTTRQGNPNEFALGEGLVGQAVLEREIILYTKVPEDYMTIRSGLGQTVARNILVAPFLYEGEVKGVIELGSTHAFTEIHKDFLEQAMENIGIAVNSAQTRNQMQTLLEATQQQAKELQAQQEQLRVNNEELEEQTQALRASEEKLQAQQEELRQTNEELEDQAKTLEQQKIQLIEKNLDLDKARQEIEVKARELEVSSKYKSEFLANMSHELRTPLNSLLILSRVLAENKGGNLTEKQLEFVQTIHSSGSDLLGLINDVLDLSKVEAGKMILNLEEIPVHRLAGYIEQHFTHMAEEKELSLSVSIADDTPASLYTDRQRVEQILKNLVSNAIKFTSEGGVTVTIGRPVANPTFFPTRLEPQNTIAIAVADTGIGIPADRLRLIFEAFQQADGTTTRKYGGTGLGLSISRELARLLGGEIHLQSEEKKGSTFTLYLPERLEPSECQQPQTQPSQLVAAPEIADGPVIAPQKAPEIHQANIEVGAIRDDRHDFSLLKKSLLIIEDDPKFAKILFDLAHERGFQCLVAGDGEAGLQLADQYHPTAIILDVGLPRMDGWTVMERLKSHPDTQEIPVHFVSAQDNASEALKMGAIGYLTKPVTFEELDQAFQTIEASSSEAVKTVLIVENDEATRTGILELLKDNTVNVVSVGTGQEAYDRLKQDAFDCMVLDLGLSDMSGFELLEQVREDQEIPYLPIIVYTGKDLTKEETLRLEQYAESTVIKGTRSPERIMDEVTLFLRKVESNLPAAQQQKMRIIHDKETVLEGKTILIVDDDMRNVFALSVVLEEKGIRTMLAEHGKHALEQLESRGEEVDLILMDIMMPEMDGYETMRRIRNAKSAIRNLPIIALTAKAMRGDRQKCIEAGANDYLSKPVDMDKLLSLLRVWLY